VKVLAVIGALAVVERIVRAVLGRRLDREPIGDPFH
jgi:hypothetical protein